jgi:hypothetical protein
MKKLAAILFGILIVAPAFGQSIIRIEVGKRGNGADADRIYRLEQAVEQLQKKVFDLEKGSVTNEKDKTTCYIKTAFDGTFTATEATETAARANVMKQCDAKSKGLSCDDSDVKCGK